MVGTRTLLSTILMSAVTATSYGATVTYSNTAPVLGVDGISNVVGGLTATTNVTEAYAEYGVNHYVAGDNAAKGQTFTTGSGSASGYTLSSITLRAPGYAVTDPSYFNLDGIGGTSFFLRVVKMGSGDQTFLTNPGITVVKSETAGDATGATIPGGSSGLNGGPGTYVTFTFATPVSLDASTVYGFDIGSDGTYANGRDFFETAGTNLAASYAGGTAYITGNNGVADPTAVALSTGDRVFYANVTANSAVPEPAALGVIGLAAVGLIRRRRA